MSMGVLLANQILKSYFNNASTGIPKISEPATVDIAEYVYVAFHTAEPTTGYQDHNEVDYPGYQRARVPRTNAYWAVTDNTVNPVNDISGYPTSVDTGSHTHFSIGLGDSGTTQIDFYGELVPNIGLFSGDTPVLSTTSYVELI